MLLLFVLHTTTTTTIRCSHINTHINCIQVIVCELSNRFCQEVAIVVTDDLGKFPALHILHMDLLNDNLQRVRDCCGSVFKRDGAFFVASTCTTKSTVLTHIQRSTIVYESTYILFCVTNKISTSTH